MVAEDARSAQRNKGARSAQENSVRCASTASSALNLAFDISLCIDPGHQNFQSHAGQGADCVAPRSVFNETAMQISISAEDFRNGRGGKCAAAGDETQIAWVFWLAIALGALEAVHAVIRARGLVDDGAFYLLRIAARGGFELSEPGRSGVQLLQQCFAVAAARAGVSELSALGQFLTLGIVGWPVVISAACWPVLPRGYKLWSFGPLLNLVAVIPSANFIGIAEGLIASCLLWLAFFLILFRTGRPLWVLAALTVTALCGFSHEAAFPFLAGLCVLALVRARSSRDLERAGLVILAIMAALGFLHLLFWSVFPRSPIERSDFLVSLLGGFLVGDGTVNLPALFGLTALLAIAAATFGIAGSPRSKLAACAASLIFGLGCIAAVVGRDAILTPNAYFASRGLPVIFTTLAAFSTIIVCGFRELPRRIATREVIIIITSLILAQAVVQSVMNERWNAYVSDMRALVQSHRGVIPFSESSRLINPDRSRFRRDLLKSWSVEPLSIALAPKGHVQAVLEAGPDEQWVPYHFNMPATLPQAPSVDWSGFQGSGR